MGGTGLFTDTVQTIEHLYQSRFGFTKSLWGGKVYLDAQALQIYASALIAYFFGLVQTRRIEKGVAFVLFIILVWFLSLTVTKSSILSFLCGFVVLNLLFFPAVFFKISLEVVCLFVGYACWRLCFPSVQF